MAERRRYSKLRVAELVGQAEVEGLRPTARKHHIPPSTLQRWRNRPEMARLRTEKHEEVAADVFAVFQKGVRRVEELIPQTDDLTKVATATGILYDKFALMSGHATQRMETADVTAKLSDHETAALEDALEGLLESAK